MSNVRRDRCRNWASYPDGAAQTRNSARPANLDRHSKQPSNLQVMNPTQTILAALDEMQRVADAGDKERGIDRLQYLIASARTTVPQLIAALRVAVMRIESERHNLDCFTSCRCGKTEALASIAEQLTNGKEDGK